MKTCIKYLSLAAMVVLVACSNNKTASPDVNTITKNESSNTAKQGDGIIGEWNMKYLAQDPNGNKILDEEEKQAANKNMNEYLQFNEDGSCRFYFTKTEGRYEVKEEKDKQVIYIYDKSNERVARYVLLSVNQTELVLMEYGGGGVDFHVFERI